VKLASNRHTLQPYRARRNLAALPPASRMVGRRHRYRDWDYTDIEADTDSSRIERIL
jgi:hypothetical protein